MVRVLVGVLLVLLLANPAQACMGARAFGMGFANEPTDATATYWAPALLEEVDSLFVVGYCDKPNQFVSYLGLDFGNWGFMFVRSDDGNYDYSQIAYGGQISEHLYAGIAWGNVNNLNLVYLDDSWFVSLLVQDWHPRVTAAYSTERLTLACEIYDLMDHIELRHIRLGMECRFNNLSLRCGCEYGFRDHEPIFFVGVGFKINDVKFDFACSTNNRLAFSIGL
jgi:hypothetical protein